MLETVKELKFAIRNLEEEQKKSQKEISCKEEVERKITSCKQAIDDLYAASAALVRMSYTESNELKVLKEPINDVQMALNELAREFEDVKLAFEKIIQ